jgi:hypothetical protein
MPKNGFSHIFICWIMKQMERHPKRVKRWLLQNSTMNADVPERTMSECNSLGAVLELSPPVLGFAALSGDSQADLRGVRPQEGVEGDLYRPLRPHVSPPGE